MKEIKNNITDTRVVYLLVSIILLISYLTSYWGLVLFVAFMLQIGSWTGFCPSKWFFGKLGFKKTKL